MTAAPGIDIELQEVVHWLHDSNTSSSSFSGATKLLADPVSKNWKWLQEKKVWIFPSPWFPKTASPSFQTVFEKKSLGGFMCLRKVSGDRWSWCTGGHTSFNWSNLLGQLILIHLTHVKLIKLLDTIRENLQKSHNPYCKGCISFLTHLQKHTLECFPISTITFTTTSTLRYPKVGSEGSNHTTVPEISRQSKSKNFHHQWQVSGLWVASPK